MCLGVTSGTNFSDDMNKASNNNNLYYSIVNSEYLNVAHLKLGYFYPPPTITTGKVMFQNMTI